MADISASNQPIRIFYSYSHKDVDHLETLKKYLRDTLVAEEVEFWHDQMIGVGREWNKEIEQKLRDSQIILLLISEHFLGSDYIKQNELEIARQLHFDDKARVIPIILRQCDWRSAPIAMLQALIVDKKPLEESENKEKAFKVIADEIKKAIQERRTEMEEINLTVCSPEKEIPLSKNEYFVGREDVISALRTSLMTHKKQALYGLGGVGKTQTAIQYAFRNKRKYTDILWLHASSREELIQEYSDFQPRKQYAELESLKGLNARSKAIAMKDWISKKEHWLMIYDNADAPEKIREFVPNQPKCHIILTSRAQTFISIGISEPIEIDVLKPEEALAYFAKVCGLDQNNEIEYKAAETLTNMLGNLPLALQQAASFIERNMTFEEYLSAYERHRLALLEEGKTIMDDYKKTVATTWRINFEKIKEISTAAADILKFSAFLSPDAIPFDLIGKGSSELGPAVSKKFQNYDQNEIWIKKAMEPLFNYSLIHLSRDKKKYSIHRLVQEVIRDEMDSSENAIWAEQTVRAISKAFPEIESYTGSASIVSQALLAKTLIEDFDFKFFESMQLITELGIILFHRGRFDESGASLKLVKKIIESEDIVKDEFLGIHGKCLNWLGILSRTLGHLNKAKEYHNSALVIAKHINDGKLEAHVNANLGAVVLWQSTFDPREVNEYWKRSLEISKNIEDDYWTVHYGIDVGYMTFLEGKLDDKKLNDALTYLEKYTEIAIKNEYRENYARGLMNQGNVWFVKDDLEKAKMLYDKALSLAEEQAVARLIWIIKHNIGNIKRKQKRYEKADKYYDEALKHLERMIKHMDEGEKQRFTEMHTKPFYSMYLLYRDCQNDDRAEGFASECIDNSLVDVKETQAADKTKGMPNYFDGYFVLTE